MPDRGSPAAVAAFGRLNRFGRERRPCFFAFSHDLSQAVAEPLDAIDPAAVRFDLRGGGNAAGLPAGGADGAPAEFGPVFRALRPPEPSAYARAYAVIRRAFLAGDSYLANLTGPTRLEYRGSLPELFHRAAAPYRLLMDGCLVFSPECFVRVEDDVIRTFPMKGSLRCPAAEAEAGAARLLADPKELAEHITVVDLLRNDLGRVASAVEVPRFRYLDRIPLDGSVLLQTSSEVAGRLEPGWPARLGDILSELLPAGSVTGAPKRRTCEYIAEAEAWLGQPRGWYTGVFGVFDGRNLDSAVMIRFLADEGPADEPGWRRGRFHSGGGITYDSTEADEYAELVAKVAFPSAVGLLETLRVEGGRAANLEGHAARMAAGAQAAWGRRHDRAPEAILGDAVAATGADADRGAGRFRLRVAHGPEGLRSASLEPYTLRRPRTLYLVEAGALRGGAKFADRSAFENLRAVVAEGRDSGAVPAPEGDWDLLLCQDGVVVDAGYAALLWNDGAGWVTPACPLVPSTRVAALEAAGFPIRRSPVEADALLAAWRPGCLRLVNALVEFEDAVEPELLIDARRDKKR